jgi:hypothetical protein
MASGIAWIHTKHLLNTSFKCCLQMKVFWYEDNETC